MIDWQNANLDEFTFDVDVEGAFRPSCRPGAPPAIRNNWPVKRRAERFTCRIKVPRASGLN